MSTIKPGDLMSYEASGVTRTGIVLDRAPGTATYWVHREDGTFDQVRIVTSGRRKGETAWLGWFTPAGSPLASGVILTAESA